MTTLDHYDFCKPYISDNEYILWEGAPEKGFTFTSRDLVMIPFSLFWLAFALFWEFSVITSTSSLFMAIWGLPFVGVGIYLLFGRRIRKRKKQIFKQLWESFLYNYLLIEKNETRRS